MDSNSPLLGDKIRTSKDSLTQMQFITVVYQDIEFLFVK